MVFIDQKLTWQSYLSIKALSTTRQVKLIDNKEFTKVALDKNVRTFVVYVAFLNLRQMTIFPARKTQIVLLVAEKVTISVKYFDFANVFLEKSVVELPKYLNINKHLIDLEPDK